MSRKETKLENDQTLSPDMVDFLREREKESKIEMLLDNAREMGIPDYTREDALKALKQEEEGKVDND